jgi:hypothetical protein
MALGQIVSQTISESKESFKKFAKLAQERIRALPARKGVQDEEQSDDMVIGMTSSRWRLSSD